MSSRQPSSSQLPVRSLWGRPTLKSHKTPVDSHTNFSFTCYTQMYRSTHSLRTSSLEEYT